MTSALAREVSSSARAGILVNLLILASFLTAGVRAVKDLPSTYLRLPGSDLFEEYSAYVNNGGPCSAPSAGPTIPVRTVDDIYSRLQYPNTTTVTLLLQNDLYLTSTLRFDATYSCTIFRSAQLPGHTVFYASAPSAPLLFLHSTSNILILFVNFHFPVTPTSEPCRPGVLPASCGSGKVCPGIYIYRSWGIQLAQGKIYGRLDAWYTAHSVFDSLEASAPGPFSISPGVFQFGQCGDARWLHKAEIVVSNNRFLGVQGSETGVNVNFHSLGVSVLHNHLSNFTAMSFNCGFGVHFIFDCFLTNFSNNYVQSAEEFYSDGAGIYYNTKYYAPENYVSCNYVLGGQHCFYLDYASSDITVEGGLCLGNKVGIKHNTGKNVKFHSVVFKDVPQEGWLSCQNYFENNCLTEIGQWWENERLNKYNTPAWKQQFPYFDEICTTTHINGVSCNPPGEPPASVTGNCSGLPYLNDLNLLLIEHTGKRGIPTILNCDSTPNIRNYNMVAWKNFSLAEAKFNAIEAMDFGVDDLTSKLYTEQENFKSCPAQDIGPKRVDIGTYVARFNIPKPSWLEESFLNEMHAEELVEMAWNDPNAWYSKSQLLRN